MGFTAAGLRRSAPIAILVPVLLLACSSPALAASCDRFASPTGSDSSAGTEAAPFRTAQRLAGSLSPGQTGCLRGGAYTATGSYVLSPEHGGAPGSPIVVRSYPGERARLVGITDIHNGVDDVTLADLTFEGTGESNTVKVYAADATIEGSEITNAWRGLSCMMLGSNSGAGQALRTVVRGNTFHACGNPANGNKDHGIYAANVLEGRIVDNVLYDSAAYAIQLYPNAQRTLFAHNVVDGGPPSVRGGVIVAGSDSHASSENAIEHNVIAYAATYNVISSWEGVTGSGNLAQDNCLWDGTDGELANGGGLSVSGNLIADPSFLDRSGHDYRLAADSPCLAKVGYDTAAKIGAWGESEPEPEPEAEAEPESGSIQAPEGETESEPEPSTPKAKGKGGAHKKLTGGGRILLQAREVNRESRKPRRRHRRTLRLRGVARPALQRRRVVIQLAAARSRWRTAAVARLRPNGRFALRLRVTGRRRRSLRLRAVIPGVARSAVARVQGAPGRRSTAGLRRFGRPSQPTT
jgi:hypothetical protein